MNRYWKIGNNKVWCEHVRDEAVNGESAAVFTTHLSLRM